MAKFQNRNVIKRKIFELLEKKGYIMLPIVPSVNSKYNAVL